MKTPVFRVYSGDVMLAETQHSLVAALVHHTLSSAHRVVVVLPPRHEGEVEVEQIISQATRTRPAWDNPDVSDLANKLSRCRRSVIEQWQD